MDDITMQQEQALDVARLLRKAGVPLFLAHPNPSTKLGFELPFGWEQTPPHDDTALEQWRPGLALCAVTGHTYDLIDVDPRSGGDEGSLGAVMPHSYLLAETPSGGRHHFIKTLGVESLDGKVSQGIDLKSGTAEGRGRGFAFIAPTVRVSKVDGLPREYRWVLRPETAGPLLPSADQLAADGSGALLRARVLEIRRSSANATPRRIAASQAHREWLSATAGLTANIAHWQRHGWGGEAHSSILAATTHLARLSPEHAEQAFVDAFISAGALPDGDDMQKLHSAIAKAVPDVVVPDSELSPVEAFFGGAAPALPGASLLPAHLFGASGREPALTLPSAGSRADAEPPKMSRFGAIDEFQAQAIEPPPPIVEGMLQRGTKARLSAPSNIGKTWVVLDLAAHVANGLPWQGRATTQTKVLYVAGEGAPSFGSRMATWREQHGGTPTGVLLEVEAPQIAQASWDEFVEFYADQDIGLFIFDTQGSVTIGLKENDNDHGNLLGSRLDQLTKRTGACVLLVHHTGWEDTTRGRGSSAANGTLDTELSISGTANSPKITLHDNKQRYIEKAKPLKLELKRVPDGLLVVAEGALRGPGGFLDGPQDAAREAVARQLFDAMSVLDPTKDIDRSYWPKLKPEFPSATQALVRSVGRIYKASQGVAIELTGEDLERASRWAISVRRENPS